MTTKVLATSLYSNDILNVGNNAVVFPGIIGQFAGHYDNYMQINMQNLDGNGSSDMVITADTGTDANNYIDMGMAGSTYNYPGYNVYKPLDGYLLVQGSSSSAPGGNLVIGTTTTGKDVVIFTGGSSSANQMAKFVDGTGFKLLNKPIYFADGSSQNTSSAPYATSNIGFSMANGAFATANSAGNYANGSFVTANSAGSYANGAFQIGRAHV